MFPQPRDRDRRHGTVSDATLDRLIGLFAAISHRALTDAEAATILSTTGPALEELRNARAKLATIFDLSEPGNVVILPGRAC
jgi:hypothetical protein